jgi:hypothetical protein
MKIVKLSLVLLLVILFSPIGNKQVLADAPDCADDWYLNFSLELSPGYWTLGEHNYTISGHDELSSFEFSYSFEVVDSAPIYDGQVMLRYWGLTHSPRNAPRNWNFMIPPEINPYQDTVFQISWIFEDQIRSEAMGHIEYYFVNIAWDGEESVDITTPTLVNGCVWEKDQYIFYRNWGPSFP